MQCSVTALDSKVVDMISGGIRPSTNKTYNSANKKFMTFCAAHGLIAIPVSETTILRYLAYLQSIPGRITQGLAHSTAVVHLSAIRQLQIAANEKVEIYTPRVKLALRSVLISHPPAIQKAPITFDILLLMLNCLPADYDGLLWHTMICTGYFGCLRASSYTKTNSYMSKTVLSPPLTLNAVKFATCKGVQYLQLTIPRTKTSLKPTIKNIGCSAISVCCHCSMLAYLRLRATIHSGMSDSPLFISKHNVIITKEMLNQKIKLLVTQIGLDPSNYSGHSLRAGSATQGARAGMSESQLSQLGNWSSSVYLRYIRDNVFDQIKHSTYLIE